MIKKSLFLSRRLNQYPLFNFSNVFKRYEKLIEENTIFDDKNQRKMIKIFDDLSQKVTDNQSSWEKFMLSQQNLHVSKEQIQQKQEPQQQQQQSSYMPFTNYFFGGGSKKESDLAALNGRWGAQKCEMKQSMEDTIESKKQAIEQYYANYNKNSLEKIKGLYVYGNPGSGKTFLMDIFYDTLEIKQKKRIHFNEFMQQVQKDLHKLQKEKYDDPLLEYAKRSSENIRVLCLDEFQVTDIADALILKKLFEHMFAHNIVLVSTSNRTPDDLYKGGLQRMLFMPFIPYLKSKCDVIDIDSNVDHRYDSSGEKYEKLQTYMSPIDEQSEEQLLQIFEKLSGVKKGQFCKVLLTYKREQKEIQVYEGRNLKINNCYNGVAYFEFDELCQAQLGSADFIAISRNFHSIIISGLPYINTSDRNMTKRFILLIDELYNQKVKLYVSAERDLKNIIQNFSTNAAEEKYMVFNEEIILVENYEAFALERIQSRLFEMQSKKYLEQPSYYEELESGGSKQGDSVESY